MKTRNKEQRTRGGRRMHRPRRLPPILLYGSRLWFHCSYAPNVLNDRKGNRKKRCTSSVGTVGRIIGNVQKRFGVGKNKEETR